MGGTGHKQRGTPSYHKTMVPKCALAPQRKKWGLWPGGSSPKFSEKNQSTINQHNEQNICGSAEDPSPIAEKKSVA